VTDANCFSFDASEDGDKIFADRQYEGEIEIRFFD
jgi:hypothetical protein